jgi:uncharacterized protein (TIGR00297 family)
LSAWQWLAGFGLGLAIALFAYLAGALSGSGAVAATVVGGITFGAGGVVPGVLLILFFVSSSLLSRAGRRRKEEFYAAFAKGGRRDHGQVLANGLAAAALSLLYGAVDDPMWLVGIAGALAASNADTWSTELGVLSRTPPRLLTSWQRVEPGTSGGVTILGTLAAFAGSAVIGITGGWLGFDAWLAISVTAAGLLGALLDSVLGASVQAIYRCPACDKETERHPLHGCGTETSRVRGWRWLNNDGVNLAASLLGAAAAIGIWLLAAA